MEGLDIRTLVLILSTLNIFVFFVYLYTRFSILKMPGIGHWALGHLTLAVCFICVWLNIESYQPPLLLLIVSSILATHFFWWSGARNFFNQKKLNPLLMGLPALIVLAFSVSARVMVHLNWIEDGALFRQGYVLLFACCAFYQLVIAKEFISYRSPRLLTSIAVGIAFIIISVLSLLKAISVPPHLPPLIVSSTTYSISTFIIVIFIQIFSMFGLVLIATERLQSKLNILAQSDPLTGLLNRRGFELLSQKKLKKRHKSHTLSAIMVFDLDHFKLINDAYGHSTGDDVLKMFANCLTKHTRSYDTVSRFGGEEFVVLCIDIDPKAALDMAEGIREFMCSHKIKSNGDDVVGITVSTGMVVIDEESPTISHYIDRADTALYHAKSTGRNKVVTAENASFSGAYKEDESSAVLADA